MYWQIAALLHLTFPVAITMFTPLDEASLKALAVVVEIWLLQFSNVPSYKIQDFIKTQKKDNEYLKRMFRRTSKPKKERMYSRSLTIHITEDIAELWFVKSKTPFFFPVFWQCIYKIIFQHTCYANDNYLN